MPNDRHLEVVKKGTDAIQSWRRTHEHARLDLSSAPLGGARLERADLSWADLRGADLSGADLSESSLVGTDLSGADLTRADLYRADLRLTLLRDTKLDGARLAGAQCKGTIFGRLDLSAVIGLDGVEHEAHSIVGVDTLVLSKGMIPAVFLEGAGVPAALIAKLPALLHDGENTLTATKHDSRVFLVHGRNLAVRDAVARFLEKLDLEVLILEEQPDRGLSIIEKFETYADVKAAVVLLTADDRGGLATEPYDAQQRRARQNVLFELGFFLGRLGRRNVCVLYEPDVEIPSDYHGVLFIGLDPTAGWKGRLARELKAMQLPIGLDDAF